MSFWTCIRTHPNSEKIAINNLARQDFTYYQPKILERKIRKQKLQYIEAPLFPCYLFVQVKDKWRSLHSTHGVAALLGGSSPAIVRDHIIVDLQNREHNGFIQLPKPKVLAIGDKVTIQKGAFAGQQALIDRMPAKDRQKILLALLDNRIKVLVDETDCIAA